MKHVVTILLFGLLPSLFLAQSATEPDKEKRKLFRVAPEVGYSFATRRVLFGHHFFNLNVLGAYQITDQFSAGVGLSTSGTSFDGYPIELMPFLDAQYVLTKYKVAPLVAVRVGNIARALYHSGFTYSFDTGIKINNNHVYERIIRVGYSYRPLHIVDERGYHWDWTYHYLQATLGLSF